MFFFHHQSLQVISFTMLLKFLFINQVDELQTTDDNFVDLAPYVDGRNLSIDLEHGADLDNYVFALFAHPPTVAQLRDLQRRRMKDQEWKAALRSLCRPFTKEEINGT